ncbi:MAG: NAD(P)-dependent alcohol dehydrogenase [Luteimonas sp.]
MRAIEYRTFGPPVQVLRTVDVAIPQPGEGEVLLRVRAASVNALDWRMMMGRPRLARLFLRRARKAGAIRIGVDVAGIVEAIGPGVVRFHPGNCVFGVCRGAFAEYACTAEDRLAAKPANVGFAAAASVPVAATTALQGLRDLAGLRAGQQLLIDGASGGVGTFAIQIAKALGAEVTAVCSAHNIAIARASGADHLIDYSRENFARDPDRYDVVFAVNAHRSLFDHRRVLRRGGVHVIGGGGLSQIAQAFLLAPLLSRLGRTRSAVLMAKTTRADLETLAGMLASGALAPVIDRRYPLEAAAEAIAHVMQGHARGKTIVEMSPQGEPHKDPA